MALSKNGTTNGISLGLAVSNQWHKGKCLGNLFFCFFCNLEDKI